MFNSEYLNRVYAEVERRDAGEPEFLQAVREVFESLDDEEQLQDVYEHFRVLLFDDEDEEE